MLWQLPFKFCVMETTDFLIRFQPPGNNTATAIRRPGPAPIGTFCLPYARQELLQWATDNFVFQQFYAGSDFAIATIDINVTEHTVLELQCTKAFNGLQYTLDGYAFAWLAGYGHLCLFKDTYTLQYVPEEWHRLFLPRGVYRFFYMDPGKLLANLAPDHPPVQKIVLLKNAQAPSGRFITRLPATETVRRLIRNFEKLPDTNGHTALLAAGFINELTHCYHRQVKYPEAGFATPELLNVFITNSLQLPEPQFFSRLKELFFISPATLERYWRRRYQTSFRGTVSRIRMLFALYLLVVEGYNVSKVATRLGYLNPSDFSRQFKRQLGFPPAEALRHVRF